MSRDMETWGTAIGAYAPDFELPGTDGNVHHLARYLETRQAVGVVFLGNRCPYVQRYLDRLKQIQADYADQGFTLIGINANDAERFPDESFENMKGFAARHRLNFPYLRDVTQEVALSFGAKTTPHVFLLNRQGVLSYRGQIDDQPEQAEAVQVHYLRDAIAQILSATPVKRTATAPIGCPVQWRS